MSCEAQAQSPLAKLPPELRLKIYGYLFGEDTATLRLTIVGPHGRIALYTLENKPQTQGEEKE